MSTPRAAVDSGTNSTRLLVLDADGRQVERRVVITRLGAGVDERGHLDDEALERTLDVLAEYHDLWVAHGVDPAHVRIAATSAVRDAADRDRYFDAVRRLTGVEAEVLTGDEEARLAFLGAAGAVDATAPVAVVDIGGGSTEIIVGNEDGQVRGAHSMQVGAVRITERHLVGDPPTEGQIATATTMVGEALAAAEADLAGRAVRLDQAATLIGVAGTITTLAGLHLGLDTYRDEAVHGTVLTAADARSWADRLLAMPVAERLELPSLPAGRADVIAGGALILAELVEHAGVDAVTVSAADNLDGLAATIS